MTADILRFEAKPRLPRRSPTVMTYTVEIGHKEDGAMWVQVRGVADNPQDRWRVARDLKEAAAMIESDAQPPPAA